jgi:hypothetical protein
MIAIYIDKNLEKYQKEIRYTFHFIFSSLGYEFKYISSRDQLSANDVLVFYNFQQPDLQQAYYLAFDKIIFYIPIVPELLEIGYWKHDDIMKYQKKIKLTKPISVISKHDFDSPVGYIPEKELAYGMFNFDLVGLIFFHLCQYEDFNFHGRDAFERILDDAHSFVDDTNYPYINELLNLFDSFLKSAIEDKKNMFIVKKEMWPQAENLAVCISHSVDKLQKWSFSKIVKSGLEDFIIFYKVGYVFKNFVNKLKYILTNVEEYWNFGIIEEIEKRFQIKSTYFWGTSAHNQHDVDYDMNAPDHIEEIVNILKQGNEIALLASYDSAKSDTLKKELAILRSITKKNEIGVRQIKFRFFSERTPEFHRKNSVAYDASQRLYERNGYKNGLALPYYFYQSLPEEKLQSDKKQDNLEIPLHFSDETLILSKFKQLSFERAKEIVDELIKNSEMVKGLVTFDFTVANFGEIPYLKDLLRYLFRVLKTKKYYNPTWLELAEWWEKRTSVIVRETANNVYLFFPHALSHFTISVNGNVEILDIHGAKTNVIENRIFFEDILKETTVRIKLKPRA